MLYCYACRNSKPARHSHFTDYGALAMRPPKRHITAIEAEWARMSEEAQAQAIEEGRQILATRTGEEGETTPRAPRPRSSASNSRRRSGKGAQDGHMTRKDWGWIGGVTGGIALFFGALWWLGRNGI